jgi:hypothetical protein
MSEDGRQGATTDGRPGSTSTEGPSPVWPHPRRVRLTPLARTLLALVLASGTLALMPVPAATSAPPRTVPGTAPVARLP